MRTLTFLSRFVTITSIRYRSDEIDGGRRCGCSINSAQVCTGGGATRYVEIIVVCYSTKLLTPFIFLGMDFEGIYRKSGPLTQINKIIAAVNRGDDVDLNDEDNYVDIMAVTSILKQYLRDLPEPLIPGSMYAEALDAANTEDEEGKRKKFVGLLGKMPKAHYKTLAFLMRHLYGWV